MSDQNIHPDAEIIRLLRQNDDQAISLIFREHYAFLCQVIVRVLSDEHIAEDLAQDVFYDLWKRRQELDISISLRAYLRRAGINKTLNYIRDRKIRWDDEDKIPQVSSHLPDANQHLETEDLKKRINQAIDDLPERCRLVFTLSRFEELSYQEIAVQLDISVKTVENQISKALKILRAVIDESRS